MVLQQQYLFFLAFCLRVSLSQAFLSVSTSRTTCSWQPHHATNTNLEEGLSIGFVGCGTIASAIATGLATQTTLNINSMAISERSQSKSTLLKEQFPDLVKIHHDNQDIVNQADLIFLCVLPAQVSPVLQSLSFDHELHTLVSLVSTANLECLAQDSKLKDVWKMICLPSVARHQGACLLCPAPPPDNNFLTPLFETLGGCIPCATEELMEAAMLSTCVMGPLYGVMRRNRDWLIDQGMNGGDADKLIRQQYLGAVAHAASSGLNLDELVEEQTPGGLNEQALRELDEKGVLKVYDQVMDSVHDRIRGQ